MWWHRLTDPTPITIPEVPDDTYDAIRVRAHLERALQQASATEERVSSVVGSAQGFHQANHFSQMAMESMSRLKE